MTRLGNAAPALHDIGKNGVSGDDGMVEVGVWRHGNVQVLGVGDDMDGLSNGYCGQRGIGKFGLPPTSGLRYKYVLILYSRTIAGCLLKGRQTTGKTDTTISRAARNNQSVQYDIAAVDDTVDQQIDTKNQDNIAKYKI